MSDPLSILEFEEQEQQWLRACEQAEADFEARKFEAAGQHWSQAFESVEGFSDDDPRRATCLNNLAITCRMAGDLQESADLYRRAESHWNSAAEWVGRMQVGSRARSSAFHLRMEDRHRRQYDHPWVERYKTMLRAGLAATGNNLAELTQASGRLREAESGYRAALRERAEAELPSDAGLAIIRINLAELTGDAADFDSEGQSRPSSATPFRERAERECWLIDRPPVFTDEGRLMAALYLTRLVEHGKLDSCK